MKEIMSKECYFNPNYIITSDGKVYRKLKNKELEECELKLRSHHTYSNKDKHSYNSSYKDYITDIGYWDDDDPRKDSFKNGIGVHRLVAFTFPEYITDATGDYTKISDSCLCVKHKDGNALNNDISNLVWCRRRQKI